ncbi:MAG: hypothetical protein IPI24_04170 [Ignavibacteria bacterium]|nr:hypothetical protein [Ignavibacteria bacterium]
MEVRRGLHEWVGLLGVGTFIGTLGENSIQMPEDAVHIPSQSSYSYSESGKLAGFRDGMASRAYAALTQDEDVPFSAKRLLAFLRTPLLIGLTRCFEFDGEWQQQIRGAIRCVHKGLTRPWPEDQALWFGAANDLLLRKSSSKLYTTEVVENLAKLFPVGYKILNNRHEPENSPQDIRHSVAHGSDMVTRDQVEYLKHITLCNLLLAGISGVESRDAYRSLISTGIGNSRQMDEFLRAKGVEDYISSLGVRFDTVYANKLFGWNDQSSIRYAVSEDSVRLVSAGRRLSLNQAEELCSRWNIFEGELWSSGDHGSTHITLPLEKTDRIRLAYEWVYQNRL